MFHEFGTSEIVTPFIDILVGLPWMGDQNIGGVTLTEDDRAKKSAGFNGIQTHDLRI
jgi:hypothetical protein